jgi:hypothetical protein
MNGALISSLSTLIPKAVAWAENQSQEALQMGVPLSEALLAVARRVDVANLDRIRILEVPLLPTPEDPLLKQAAIDTGLLGPNMVGLTLGHAVLVCSGYAHDVRLLSHEFRHVYQYEQEGSISAFLSLYLQQIVTLGYESAPFEIDARQHEIFE